MLPVRQTREVLLLHVTAQIPLLGELAVPLAAYAVAFGVVIPLRVGELLFVIRLRLACTERRFLIWSAWFTYSKYGSCPAAMPFDLCGSRGLISCAGGALGCDGRFPISTTRAVFSRAMKL